jgi:hypothetical protein
MSNFGAAVDFRGKPFTPAFQQGMIAYDIDSFICDFDVDAPNHLKIDVDGLGLSIVRGARRTLANPALQSVSIELIDSDLAQVSEVTEILRQAGLVFIQKKQNPEFATAETRDVLNYLFHRDPARFEALREGSVSTEPRLAVATATTLDLVRRIVHKIVDAPIDPEPCLNLFMEDVFPPSVYAEMLMRLPKDEALAPIKHPDAMTPDGRSTRFLLDLTGASLSRLPEVDRPFWETMIEAFTSPDVSAAIVAKFFPALEQRFGSALPELVPVPIFYRDYPGYRISVHPDAASKIATMQFYLPEDLTQRHLGTTFHRRENDSYEALKTNPFIPNSAYAFVRTEESWHSVDEISPGENARNSIALTFYIKGQEYRSEEVAPPTPMMLNFGDKTHPSLQTQITSFSRREDVVRLFKSGGVGVELGVAAGDFSERILKHDHVGFLFSIDMWAGDRGHGIDQYREAIAKLDTYRDRNTVLRMRFDEALPLFIDESLDFIYVDGYAHDGEMNGQTFRDWFPKLRRGGIISGDDYAAEWPLVVAAVNAFATEFGLEVHVINCHEDTWNSRFPTWFAMKP